MAKAGMPIPSNTPPYQELATTERLSVRVSDWHAGAAHVERAQQPSGRRRHLVDRRVEDRLVVRGGFAEAADLAHELARSLPHLGVVGDLGALPQPLDRTAHQRATAKKQPRWSPSRSCREASPSQSPGPTSRTSSLTERTNGGSPWGSQFSGMVSNAPARSR